MHDINISIDNFLFSYYSLVLVYNRILKRENVLYLQLDMEVERLSLTKL